MIANSFRTVVIAVIILNVFMIRAWVHTMDNIGVFAIYFLDVGQGDAILIKSPDNLYALIDGGRGNVVLEELDQVLANPKENIDLVIATHPDADHIEGIISVLENFEVENIFWQKMAKQTDQYLHLQSLVTQMDINDYQLHEEHDFKLGCCVEFDVVWPRVDDRIYDWDDANEASYGIVVSYMGQKIFLGGDLGSKQEDLLLQGGLADVYILKAGHHGSSTSSSPQFLAALNPVYTVISAGAGNSYGHPSIDVLENLYKADTQILRTDIDGRVEFRRTREKWTIITEK